VRCGWFWSIKASMPRSGRRSARSRPRSAARRRRCAQYVSIKYTDRLAEAGVEPSVGSIGDSYDNALAETINGLYKTEVIRRRGPWRSYEAVEFATLEWVDWFNNRRIRATRPGRKCPPELTGTGGRLFLGWRPAPIQCVEKIPSAYVTWSGGVARHKWRTMSAVVHSRWPHAPRSGLP
jgi:hypothetical protein